MQKYDPVEIKNELLPIQNVDSYKYLAAHRAILEAFDSFDDMVWASANSPTKELTAYEFHFVKIRNELLKALWSKTVYLGRTLAEEIIFAAIKINDAPFHEKIVSIIETNNLHEPGLIVYPLSSFGIYGAGFGEFFGSTRTSVEMPEQGVILYPQANNDNLIYQRIKRALKSFSITGSLDADSLAHYLKSRPLKWVHQNPIMLVHARAFQWDYFANHFAIKLKLILAKGYVIFLNLNSSRELNDYTFTSTSKVNNWETLDIKHYLILQPKMSDKASYDVKCIPMNAEPNEMADLSELSIDLDPKEWAKRKPFASNLKQVFNTVETGIILNCYFSNKDKNHTKVFSKLKNSISYFNKSFRKADKHHESIVMLSIAFETLLLDNYSRGIGSKLDKRVRLAVKGTKGCKKYWKKIGQLYDARCEIVHAGETQMEIDLKLCQEAFSKCWAKIASAAESLPTTTIANPVGVLIGDT